MPCWPREPPERKIKRKSKGRYRSQQVVCEREVPAPAAAAAPSLRHRLRRLVSRLYYEPRAERSSARAYTSRTVAPANIGPPPKDAPPATPVVLPACNPVLGATGSEGEHDSVVRCLQAIYKPSDLDEAHFRALGVHVHTDASAEQVLPDSTFLPTSGGWEGMTIDEAAGLDLRFRRQLSNEKLSPEARVYLERQQELSTINEAAFRTVRRVRPDGGATPVRLGNAYEFFRQLELIATYWDDTSVPPLPVSAGHDDAENAGGEIPPPLPARPGTSGEASGAGTEVPGPSAQVSEAAPLDPQDYRVTYRTAQGSSMPPELRHTLITSFVRLVSYDFGCNPAPPKVEPRFHLIEPAFPAVHTRETRNPKTRQASYFPSGCVFLWRNPLQREAARAGHTEGPLYAISARGTTNFSAPIDHRIDFARELVAALATAQLRAREGQEEKRFGEGQWWAHKERWGGGEGGPIGREEDRASNNAGDKDSRSGEGAPAPPSSPSAEKAAKDVRDKPDTTSPTKSRPLSSMFPSPLGIPLRIPIGGGGVEGGGKGTPGMGEVPNGGPPAPKRVRKAFSMYDNYRRIRPPTSNWDKRAKYIAIGKQKGADFDDVFVVSSVFHHLSVLRVRVPQRLLEVLGGATQSHEKLGELDWGKLEMWRSEWFDLFVVKERLEALRIIWGMTAWMMRSENPPPSLDIDMKAA